MEHSRMKKYFFFLFVAIIMVSCNSKKGSSFYIINDTNNLVLIEDIEHPSRIPLLKPQDRHFMTSSQKITDNFGEKGAIIMYQGQKYLEKSYKGSSFLNLKNYVFTGKYNGTFNPDYVISEFDFKITEDYIFSLPKVEE
jgi:hypothetical protein